MDPRTRRAVGHILLLRMRPCRGSLFFGAQLPWRSYNVSSHTPLFRTQYSSRQHEALAKVHAIKVNDSQTTKVSPVAVRPAARGELVKYTGFGYGFSGV